MEPMILSRRIVGLKVDYELRPVFSSGVSLDFFRDLLHGGPEPGKDYSAPCGMVGYSKGGTRYTATYSDGSQGTLTEAEYTDALATIQASQHKN